MNWLTRTRKMALISILALQLITCFTQYRAWPFIRYSMTSQPWTSLEPMYYIALQEGGQIKPLLSFHLLKPYFAFRMNLFLQRNLKEKRVDLLTDMLKVVRNRMDTPSGKLAVFKTHQPDQLALEIQPADAEKVYDE